MKKPQFGPGRPGRIFDVTLYKVTANTDTTEGRGSTYVIGWFVDAGVAKKAAKGKGVMGTDSPVDPVACSVIRTDDGSVFLVGDEVQITYEDPKEVRERALAKLTPEERNALGIK